MSHFQQVRFQSDLRFIENFKNVFNVTLLEEIPQEEVRIYQATARKWAQMREEKKRENQQHDVLQEMYSTWEIIHEINESSSPNIEWKVLHLLAIYEVKWRLNATIPVNDASQKGGWKSGYMYDFMCLVKTMEASFHFSLKKYIYFCHTCNCQLVKKQPFLSFLFLILTDI